MSTASHQTSSSLSSSAASSASGSSGSSRQPPTGQRLTPARAAQRHAVTTAWCQAIHDWYPDFLSRTLFTPPVHFNRVSYQVENVSGLSVLVPQQASDQPPQAPPGIYPHAAPAPPPPGTNPHPTIPPPPTIPALPPVGLLFPPPPSTPAPVAVVQDNDVRNDACLQLLRKCLSVLGENHSEVMMVVCELEFRKFLDGETDPIHRAHCALFPRPSDMRARSDRSGDFDLLIVHRHYGLVTVEAKAVGADPSKVPSMDKALVKIVGRAVKQLNKEHVVVCHLVHDLTPNPLRVTRCLMLPYVTCQQLTQALATSPAVAQDLVQCVDGQDVQDAISRCLCADQVPDEATLRAGSVTSQLTGWWQVAVQGAGPDPHMSDDIYLQLLARFCGPATTVEVASPTPPRRIVRTEGQAVAETGLRFSSLALTPQQVSVLNMPDLVQGNGIVCLVAPPGCGKTLMLYLKARQWLNQGRHVHLLCLTPFARAVSSILAAQLSQDRGTTAAVTVHTFDFANKPGDAVTAVSTLTGLAVPGVGVHVIVDEGDRAKSFDQFCRGLRSAVPNTYLWAALQIRSLTDPSVMRVVSSLTIPLRCPPSVQREVEKSDTIDGGRIPLYSRAPWPTPTDGPAIRWLKHHQQPDHVAGAPRDCQQCGRVVARLLRDLGVGRSELQWRDVFVICRVMSATAPFVLGLQQEGVPVSVLLPKAPQSDVDQMALALRDQVTVLHSVHLSGLERRVVVGMEGGDGFMEDRRSAMSRCTGLLVWIDEPRDA